MTITTTSVLSNSVRDEYDADYLLSFMDSAVWYALFKERMLKKVIDGKNLAGTTVYVPIFGPLARPTSSLTETYDVDPVSMVDAKVGVTINEEGNVVQTTRLLSIASYTNIEQVAARAVGKNQAERIDTIIRDSVAYGATDKMYANNLAALTDLDATNDLLDYSDIAGAKARMKSRGVPPFPGGDYVTIINPIATPDLSFSNSVWQAVSEYSDPTLICTGDLTVLAKGGRWPGEIGRIAGVRFIEHEYGAVLFGAGTTAQAATTLAAAVAAGDTSFDVADATGITAGDWITIGTLPTNSTAQPTTEQVLVTNVATNTLTIQGAGNAPDDWGLKFAHASGAAVTEAANVIALPIMGPESAVVAWADEVGEMGEVAVRYAPTNIADRFLNHSWYWVGGSAKVDRNLVVLYAATSGHMYGNN
jgi:N4-gp56 family major capsid protein